MAATLTASLSKASPFTASFHSAGYQKDSATPSFTFLPRPAQMLSRLGAHLGRTLQLSSSMNGLPGPANGARTVGTFVGNRRPIAPPPQNQEEASPPSGGGLREVPFTKEITNHVKVIGRLGRDPEIKHLEMGRTVAKMILALSKPKSTDGSDDAEWIDVETWDSPGSELATIAASALRKGTRVAVQGRLRIDKWEDRQTGEKRSKPKIIADDLALVSDSMESSQGASYASQGAGAASYASQGGAFAPGGSSYASTSAASPATGTPPGQKSREELWENYFADPSQWWDNRQNKQSLRSPDFKHKETKEALWIDDRRTPAYVMTRLAEESPAAADHPLSNVSVEEVWKNLYEEPSSWWDNRTDKKFQDAPDFVHKETRQALRINDKGAPQYLVSREALADLDQRFVLVAQYEREEYQELWEDLFANPQNWHDNRFTKSNPKAPDFVNKESREVVLWINDKRVTPEILKRIPGGVREGSQAGQQRQMSGSQ